MSTPDNQKDKQSSAPVPPNGVNAWKVNRMGLAAPAAKGEPARFEKPAPVASARQPATKPVKRMRPKRQRVLNGAAILALVLAVGAVWYSNRRPEIPVKQPSAGASGLPLVRSEQKASLPAYRALVIGINQYAQFGGDGWQTLNSARLDAEEIAKTLADNYGFHVQTLLDGEASRGAILNALDEMAISGADGADLIYFAGHGYFDDKLQEGYWIPADARKSVDGRQAKEDWLWNSTITRLINASQARHVLVMSDACYSGSLFRGGDEPLVAHSGQAWYERAISKPSRYLITSGGLEPVLDSGAGHSVFAQEVLDYLSHGDRNVFSSNDLGLALREEVAKLTGQMVQMGPLPVSSHAGGEFVFVRQKAGEQMAAFTSSAAEVPSAKTRGPDQAVDAKSRQEAIHDAVALTRAGAPKAAGSLVSILLQENVQDQLARSVSDYIKRSQHQEGRDELRKLIEQVEAKGKAAAQAADGSKAVGMRPRVIACIGPSLPAGGNSSDETTALLYRIVLRSELEARAGLKVVEREALETLLQEQNVGVSDLADPRARLTIGKLLPASLLLLGDMLPDGQGERIFVRLVDTETTQVLSSFTVSRKADEDPDKVCAELAGKIAERVTLLKPLLAPVTEVEGTRIQAGLGTYHGIRGGLGFTVLSRTLRNKKVPDDFTEQEVGTATVCSTSEYACELDAKWLAGSQARVQNLWIRERTVVANP